MDTLKTGKEIMKREIINNNYKEVFEQINLIEKLLESAETNKCKIDLEYNNLKMLSFESKLTKTNNVELEKKLELATQNKHKNDLEYNRLKDYYVANFSHAIVTEKAIEKIEDFLSHNKCKVLLEIGSGFGLWSALINLYIKKKENVVSVIATDKIKYSDHKLYYDVKQLDYESAIKECNEKYDETLVPCLFLCWPPRDENVASNSLKQFKGNYLIFIGEESGNVATPEFFNILEEEWDGVSPSKGWEVNDDNYFNIPRWHGVGDSIIFYKRKVHPEKKGVPADGRKSKRRRQTSKRKYKPRRQTSKRKYKPRRQTSKRKYKPRRQSSKRKSKRRRQSSKRHS
jgi:hypothetical protein